MANSDIYKVYVKITLPDGTVIEEKASGVFLGLRTHFS